MALVTIRFWAAAARAVERDEEQFDAATVGELRTALGARPALQKIAVVASILVDGQAVGEATVLTPGAVVDVLPAYSAG